MPEPPEAGQDEPAPAQRERVRRPRVRATVRALHRDAGYFVIGLTVVYALSGLAVNHIADWDPSFENYERVHTLEPLSGDDDAVAKAVLGKLQIQSEPSDVYRVDEDNLEIVLDKRTLHVELASGKVLDQGQRPRFFLRAANYLHLNRGKKAWTIVADGYAILLLFLAISGLFMLPGRKGLVGRGAVIASVGAAIPVLYVLLSGSS